MQSSDPTPATAPEAAARRRAGLPLALLWALGSMLLASCAAWLGAVALMPKHARTLLVLGDSGFAGYRMAPGARFQDWLARELGTEWSVVNFAEPAAQAGDFYLQLAEAEFLRVRPEVVVIGLAPQKLVPEFAQAARFNEDGTNLRWLPLNSEGYRFYQTLDAHQRRVAVARKAGLVFGFYEALRALSLEYVEWPLDRRRRAHAGEARRRAWIQQRAQELDERWAHASRAGREVQRVATHEAQDFAFLAEALRARGVRSVVVMPPEMHTGVLRLLSPDTLHNLDEVYQQTLELCARLGLPVLDFNAPGERERFLPSQWDDLNHLRSPEGFRRMAQALQRLMLRPGWQGELTPA